MKGLELAERYYREYGEPMLKERFPVLLPFLAVGVAGSGSECLGYDDEVSADHDFGPGFTIFLPDEEIVSRRDAFLLERAYASLPAEFLGFRRQTISPAGGNRFGVRRMSEFFEETAGSADGTLSTDAWLSIPEQYLLEATNGRVFYDGRGEFTRIREALRAYPEDVRLKKMAGYLVLLSQSGQYNYGRCIRHGETGAAALSLHDFVKAALHLLFLLNRRYLPFYKWSFRAARDLDRFLPSYDPKALAADLEFLLSHPNEGDALLKKQMLLESIEQAMITAVREEPAVQGTIIHRGLPIAANPYRIEAEETETAKRPLDAGTLAEALNAAVSDPELRNRHILSGANL